MNYRRTPRVDSPFAERLSKVTPWIGMGALLLALLWSRRQVEQVQAEALEVRERVTARLTAEAIARDSALQVGDAMPEQWRLQSFTDTTTLSALIAAGVRYLYLYRADCPGCMELAPIFDEATPAARSQVAFIAYRPHVDEPAGTQWPQSYGVLGAGDDRRHAVTQFVPAMLELDSRGRVLSVADGFASTVRFLRSRGFASDTSFIDRVAIAQ